MNDALAPDHRHVGSDVRASIAAQLAAYYSELGRGAVPPRHSGFSLARHLNVLSSPHLQFDDSDREILNAAAQTLGQMWDPHRSWIPLSVLGQQRSLDSVTGPKGGYLAGVDTVAPIDVLRPWSVVARAGVTLMTGLRDSVVIPRATTAPAGTWVRDGAAPAEASIALGAASMTARTAVAFVRMPLQLVRQAEAAEPFVRSLLSRAVGELLDTACLAGAGGAEPLGLLSTAGVNATSGSSLAHAGLLAMREAVLAAGAQEDALQWVGPPAVQQTLGARELATGGGRFVWDATGILGRPAAATKNAPASSLIVGDFSEAIVGIWGPGIRLDVDPTQDFNSGGVVVRVMLMCDVAFPRPEAFAVATSIT